MIPAWFSVLSVAMLALGGICALVIVIDLLLGHPQQMGIMNVVWPVTALFGTVFAIWAYFRYGRLSSRQKVKEKQRDQEPSHKMKMPFPVMVGKGAAHCGSGCTLGDIAAEFLTLWFPIVLTWVGWKWLFPDTHAGKVFAGWVLDYIFAFIIGVAFQYFTIAPMRKLPLGQAILQAVKADALSLTAWQVGMYGVMALAEFVLFASIWPQAVGPDRPEFWFAMQVGMLAGFITSYPVNWWLLRAGVKETM